MKKLFYVACLSLMSLFTSAVSAQNVSLTPLWETDTLLKTPESVLFSPQENVLYVACINGSPNAQNKNSFIAKLGTGGKVIQLKFTENLNSTKGMAILGDKLYVTEMTNVVEIALSTGKVLNRYPVEGSKFLNDIAVDTKNTILYISDSGTGNVSALKNGKISLVFSGDPLKNTNGLLFENNQLLIGNGDGTLFSMHPTTKKLQTLSKVSAQIDGIAGFGNKKYIVSEWGGKIWYIHADGSSQLLSNSSKEKINTADLCYDAKTKILYVPTFFHNTVKAYLVK